MSETVRDQRHCPEVLTHLEPGDLERLTEILSDAFEATAEELAEFIPLAIEAPHSDMIISRNAEGQIAGTMVVNVKHGTSGVYGVVDDVATHLDSRREGHAAAVLDYALDWFRARGARGVALHSEDGLDAAHNLYKSRGFAIYETNYFMLELQDPSA